MSKKPEDTFYLNLISKQAVEIEAHLTEKELLTDNAQVGFKYQIKMLNLSVQSGWNNTNGTGMSFYLHIWAKANFVAD
jgi:hypothetical protein